jgi:Leucine-rich repeat (LRR) protein
MIISSRIMLPMFCLLWGCQQAAPPAPPTAAAKPTAKPAEILQVDATNYQEVKQDESLRFKQEYLSIQLEEPAEVLVILQRIDALTSLTIEGATLTEEVLHQLPKRLSTLSLRGIKTPLTSIHAQHISKIQLTTLGLRQLTFDCAFLENLENPRWDTLIAEECHVVELSKLQFFDLPFQHFKDIRLVGLELTDANFKTAKKAFWNCESLDLARNDLSDATVQELRVLRFLDYLDLEQNEQVTGTGFEQWPSTKLNVLNLRHTGLNDAGFQAITKKLTLRYFDISGNTISRIPAGAMEKIKEIKIKHNHDLLEQLRNENVSNNRIQSDFE